MQTRNTQQVRYPRVPKRGEHIVVNLRNIPQQHAFGFPRMLGKQRGDFVADGFSQQEQPPVEIDWFLRQHACALPAECHGGNTLIAVVCFVLLGRQNYACRNADVLPVGGRFGERAVKTELAFNCFPVKSGVL